MGYKITFIFFMNCTFSGIFFLLYYTFLPLSITAKNTVHGNGLSGNLHVVVQNGLDIGKQCVINAKHVFTHCLVPKEVAGQRITKHFFVV